MQISSNGTIEVPRYVGLTIAMMHGSGQGRYSNDEIEQILGMGAPEAGRAVKEIRETIRDNPLLVTGLVLAFGILIGVSLCRARKS